MRIWIHSPLAVLLAEDQPCGGVVVNDDEIEAVLPPGETLDGPVDERVDAAGLVLLPGLVNTHHHYCQNLTRALRGARDRELFPWLKTLYPIWEGLTPEMIRASTQLAAAELMLSGCTTSTDHHYLFTESLTDAFDIQARAVAETGMRTVLTRGSMSPGAVLSVQRDAGVDARSRRPGARPRGSPAHAPRRDPGRNPLLRR